MNARAAYIAEAFEDHELIGIDAAGHRCSCGELHDPAGRLNHLAEITLDAFRTTAPASDLDTTGWFTLHQVAAHLGLSYGALRARVRRHSFPQGVIRGREYTYPTLDGYPTEAAA